MSTTFPILCPPIKGCQPFRDGDRRFVLADCDVDADGANGQGGGLPCYAPHNYPGRTLDDLSCAGHPGNWWGIVTHNGRPDGDPIVQSSHDPCPGAYISATSLRLLGQDGHPLPEHDPRTHVDAATVPFIVLPGPCALADHALVLGCRARLTYRGRSVDCVVADKGPTRKIGEASPAACRAVGIPDSARSGGVESREVLFEWWPGEQAIINGAAYPLQRWNG